MHSEYSGLIWHSTWGGVICLLVFGLLGTSIGLVVLGWLSIGMGMVANLSPEVTAQATNGIGVMTPLLKAFFWPITCWG